MKECVRTGSCWVIFENTAKGEADGEMGEPRRASAVEDLEHLARERVWLYPVGGRDQKKDFQQQITWREPYF